MIADSMLIAYVVLGCVVAFVAANSSECCKTRGVPEYCRASLCDPNKVPEDMLRYKLFEQGPDEKSASTENNCSSHLADISFCMADGRDHTHCCENRAADKEENSCFTLCRGAFPTLPPGTWNRYRTCIALNLESIYQCYQQGYKTNPTPPRDVQVENSTEGFRLSWKAPEKLHEKVDKYRVKIVDHSAAKLHTSIRMTNKTTLVLDDLKRNREWTVSVVAVTRQAGHASLDSETVNFNTYEGRTVSSSVLSAGRATVPIPKNAPKAIIACKLRSTTEGSHEIVWSKKQPNGSFSPLTNPRFNSNYYKSRDHDVIFLSALEINSWTPADYGIYQCRFKGGGPTAEVDIVQMVSPLMNEPPETVLECCQRNVVRPECQEICSPDMNASKRQDLRKHSKGEGFMTAFNCNEEMYTLLSCSLAEMRNAACCVRKQVPYYCLGLCDKDVRNGPVSPSCRDRIDSITECQMDAYKMMPAAVDDLKIEGDQYSVSLSWSPSKNAENYHVHYRKKSSDKWSTKQITSTSIDVQGAEQIVLVSSNAFGKASAIRLYYDGEWLSSYE